MHFFQQPCPAGWMYPCSLEDIALRIAELPQADLEGLYAIGLVPSTRKDWKANARYIVSDKPAIHIYSYPDTLRFRLPAHTRPAEIEQGFLVEHIYGMTVEQDGNRFVCAWKSEDLRRFVVEHVLAHEVGHHIYHRTRQLQGYACRMNTTASEQFAEAYALRFRKPQNRLEP